MEDMSENEFSEDLELYYYSRREGVVNIYKSDLNGNETVIIEDNEHHDWWVRVSPDKTKMLWYKSPLDRPENQHYNNYKEAELWMANIDGSDPHKVIDLEDYNWAEQGVADWSPDGTQLVMAAVDTSEHFHLFITDDEGQNPFRLTNRNSLFVDPSWSPDGQKIVYSAYPAGSLPIFTTALEIHTINIDGTDETRLTFDDFQDHDPYWSPDGKEIAFESLWGLSNCSPIGKWSIRKHDLETGATIAIIEDEHGSTVPRWSPDSEQLYFARLECFKFAGIFRVDRDGSNMQEVIRNNDFPQFDCDVVE